MDKVLTTMLFTKRDSLAKYGATEKVHTGGCAYYDGEREISLVLKLGINHVGSGDVEYVGRIFCPINPLPVVGEFKTPSKNAVVNFLREQGWNLVTNVRPATLAIVAKNV